MDGFRRLFMERPDDLRRRMYGSNAERVREMSALQRAALRCLDISPDLLEPVGLLHYEPAHSRLISFLLDPRRSDIAVPLLRSFLVLSSCPDSVLDLEDLRRAKVVPEAPVPEGRIDVSIETSTLLVYVEVKVHAQEGPDQLARYRNALDRSSKPITRLVYLTLPDALGPTQHLQCEHLSFSALLAAWLPLAATVDTGDYLARYLKSLARLMRYVGHRSWHEWTFAEQRSALRLVLGEQTEGATS